MSASLACQKAIRAALVADAGVIALVPAASILDRNARPNPTPSIIIGEDQELDEDRIARNVVRVFSTVHVWQREAGLTDAKRIAGAIRLAVRAIRMETVDGWFIGDSYVSSTRFLRDPDGETSHGVVTIETMLTEMAAI